MDIQDENGCWNQYSYHQIPHAYHSRVAWAIAQLYEIEKDYKYLNAVRKHIKWILSNQQENGWFQQAGFTLENHNAPYTHTIAYTIRGVLEIGIILKDETCINAATKSSDELLKVITAEGFLWGKYNDKWEAEAKFSCLTGNAQFSIICFRLYKLTNDSKYLNNAVALNNYLKSKQLVDVSNKNICGAILGSWPIWGEYKRFSYPNWATKFFVDALMLEKACQK